MTLNRFFCAQAILLVLLCFGCSQRRFVSQRKLIDEIARLAPGSHLSVHDQSGVKYKGILLAPTIIPPDSTQVLVIETVPDRKKYQFRISPELARTEVTRISIPRKTNAGNVLTGRFLGMIGGVVVGPYVGAALSSEYDDTLTPQVLGGLIGSIVGFITGAVVVEAATGELIFILGLPSP